MALPIMDHPTYELQIPSTKKKIKYRPFLVKEEKVLLLAMESGDENNIKQAVIDLLTACIKSKIKIESLSLFDLEYIFLNIRAVSVGEVVEMKLTCSDDGKTEVPYALNLTEISVIFPKGHSKKIMLTKDTGVIMKYPSFKTFLDQNFGTGESITQENLTSIIAENIDQIFQGEDVYDSSTTTKKEFIEFVESLTNEQLLKLQKFFETSPRLEHAFTIKNPNTGVESEYVLRGLNSFFG